MKSIYLVILSSVILLSSCKKGQLCDPPGNNPPSAANARLVKSGQMLFNAKIKLDGTAKLLQQPNGKYILVIDKMNYSSNFDLNIYLSPTPELSATSRILYSARDFVSGVPYEIHSGIDVPSMNYLLIEDEKDTELFAKAIFQ